MPHDRFSNFLSMGRKLVADRRANEVSSVGIKALLHQQIDMAQVDVTEVDCDLFCFAGFVAKAMNFSGHGNSPSLWMVYGCLQDGFKGCARRPWTAKEVLAPKNGQSRVEIFPEALASAGLVCAGKPIGRDSFSQCSSNNDRFLPKADTLGLRCLGRISERRLRQVVWLRPPLPHQPGRKVGAGDGTARRAL